MHNLFCENGVLFALWIKIHFNINRFALSLALEQRFLATRNWPIALVPFVQKVRRPLLFFQTEKVQDLSTWYSETKSHNGIIASWWDLSWGTNLGLFLVVFFFFEGKQWMVRTVVLVAYPVPYFDRNMWFSVPCMQFGLVSSTVWNCPLRTSVLNQIS